MGKWADQYIEKKSAPLTETTAKSCQKPNQAGGDPLLSVIGSGFVTADKKTHFLVTMQKNRKYFRKLLPKAAKSQADVLSKFTRLVQHYGADNGLLLEEAAIFSELDTEGIADLQAASTAVRQSWAEALAIRLVQVRGIVPEGWDKTSVCAHCGPVWSFHDMDALSCNWCWMRLVGRWFPKPQNK